MTRRALMFIATLLVAATTIPVVLMKAAAQATPTKTSIEDKWQGTLHIPGGKDLRTVVKVFGTGAAMKATMYSVDQGGQPIPASSVSFENGVFKYAVTFIDGSYEGKMSADGKSINGTWKQGPATLPLVFERTTPATEWAIAEPIKISAMTAKADPSFEVATIKPSRPEETGKMLTFNGQQFRTINTTLMDLMKFALSVQEKEILGVPDWASSEKFDIDGKPDTPGVPSTKQLKAMIEKLLNDRFQLKFHRDNRQLSAYVLSVGKNGPKLQKHDGDPDGLPRLFFQQLGVLTVQNATMQDFTGLMQGGVLDRPVLDHTGLEGRWDFLLKWTPDETQFIGFGIRVPSPTDVADAPPPLFTAIQEQLGLKLEAEKTSVPVIVLDHIERPSAN